jgi:hypothetical protein
MRLVGLAKQPVRKAHAARPWWPAVAGRTPRGPSPTTASESGAKLMSEVVIYADGACKGNPGPVLGAVLKSGDVEKEMFGGETMTTNNRMELTA